MFESGDGPGTAHSLSVVVRTVGATTSPQLAPRHHNHSTGPRHPAEAGGGKPMQMLKLFILAAVQSKKSAMAVCQCRIFFCKKNMSTGMESRKLLDALKGGHEAPASPCSCQKCSDHLHL